MAVNAPANGNAFTVVDRSSEFKGMTGTVVSVDLTNQFVMARLDRHNGTVRLQFRQISGTFTGGAVTLRAGNNPHGSVHGAGDARHVPKSGARRDTLGSGFNPSDPTGTIGDTRTPANGVVPGQDEPEPEPEPEPSSSAPEPEPDSSSSAPAPETSSSSGSSASA